MHNIQTAAAVADGDYPWANPVLTVRDSLFREVRFLFRDDAVVVDPWVDPVTIEREDLFALRELLNELPEEAFVRPADPVEVPTWAEGDRITHRIVSTGHTVTYVRGRHVWDRYVTADDGMVESVIRADCNDEAIEYALANEVGLVYTVRRRGGKVL